MGMERSSLKRNMPCWERRQGGGEREEKEKRRGGGEEWGAEE